MVMPGNLEKIDHSAYSFPFHVRQTLRKNLNKVTLGPNAKNQSAKAASVESAKVQLTLPF